MLVSSFLHSLAVQRTSKQPCLFRFKALCRIGFWCKSIEDVKTVCINVKFSRDTRIHQALRVNDILVTEQVWRTNTNVGRRQAPHILSTNCSSIR